MRELFPAMALIAFIYVALPVGLIVLAFLQPWLIVLTAFGAWLILGWWVHGRLVKPT